MLEAQEIPFAYQDKHSDYVMVWGTHVHEVAVHCVKKLYAEKGWVIPSRLLQESGWHRRWTGADSILDDEIEGFLEPQASTDIPWMARY